MNRLLPSFALIACLLVPSGALAGEAEWTVTPYLFATTVSGDLTVRGASTDFEADFGDILENLEVGGMLRVSALGERWGFAFDAAFTGLGQSSRIGDASIDLDQTTLELAGIYRANERLDVLFGVRYWEMDAMLDFAAPALPDPQRTVDWVDPFVGLRLHAPMGGDWRFAGRLDVGGFDLGSEFSYNVELGFGWRATERFELMLGWRVLDVDYESGAVPMQDRLNLTYSGPEVGFAFHF